MAKLKVKGTVVSARDYANYTPRRKAKPPLWQRAGKGLIVWLWDTLTDPKWWLWVLLISMTLEVYSLRGRVKSLESQMVTQATLNRDTQQNFTDVSEILKLMAQRMLGTEKQSF